MNELYIFLVLKNLFYCLCTLISISLFYVFLVLPFHDVPLFPFNVFTILYICLLLLFITLNVLSWIICDFPLGILSDI